MVAVSLDPHCAAGPADAPAKGGAATAPAPGGRLYYLDWAKALVIALVIVFHTIDLVGYNYTYSAAYYLGIVNPQPAGAGRTVAIVIAQLMQVRAARGQRRAGLAVG
jgi:hypothetical protein